jgi:spermidine synthase
VSERDVSVVLAREKDETGEVVLRRRGDVLELVVDGVFAMDTVHTSSEQALASLALDRLGRTYRASMRGAEPGGVDILVAGLGLGFTCATILADPRVRSLVVVEMHPAVVDWTRRGLIAPAVGVLEDPRVVVRVGDVLDVVPALPAKSLDALLLDVDNGPGFLTHPGNTAVYSPPFLAAAARTLRAGGVLGVWSAEPAPELALAIERVCGSCDEVLLTVSREGREFTYAVYLGLLW